MMKDKKVNIIISCMYLINFLLLIIFSTGIIKENEISEYYFFSSFAIIPVVLILISLSMYKRRVDNKEAISKNDIFLYPLSLFSCLMIGLFGIKMMIQLEEIALMQILIISLSFIALLVVITFIFRDKEYSFKRQTIYFVTTYFTLDLYMIVMAIMAYDYSTLF